MSSKNLQQFPIPKNFPELLNDMTKEVLRNQPKDIYEFCAMYFRCMQEETELDYPNKGQNIPCDFKNVIPGKTGNRKESEVQNVEVEQFARDKEVKEIKDPNKSIDYNDKTLTNNQQSTIISQEIAKNVNEAREEEQDSVKKLTTEEKESLVNISGNFLNSLIENESKYFPYKFFIETKIELEKENSLRISIDKENALKNSSVIVKPRAVEEGKVKQNESEVTKTEESQVGDEIDRHKYFNEYLSLLLKHSGFFNLKTKIPVRDRYALSLVYTPGVGACCLEIQKNQQLAYTLTNKMNSMLVVTDSSGFPNSSREDYNNMVPIPFLEAICIYYKEMANIDCYPLILDHKLIIDGNTLAETIKKIMPAYSFVEFFNIDQQRVEQYHKATGEDHNYGIISNQGKIDLEKKLKKKGIKININIIYSALIRAALDMQAYFRLDSVLENLLNEVLEGKVTYISNDPYGFMEKLVHRAAEILKEQNLVLNKGTELNLHNKECTPEYVTNKYHDFTIQGERSWVETYPDNYTLKQGNTDDNSIFLHRRYRGFICSGFAMNFGSVVELDRLVSWFNCEKLSGMFMLDPQKSEMYSCRSNLGSIITNGTAILGLGDIGALSGLPTMEGKSILFKLFGGVNIIPICIEEKDPKKLIAIVNRISPIFSAINLEDIKAPECFEVERALINDTSFPVFHDDQHGTAIVVLAGMINALKLIGKTAKDLKVVMNGAGAAGLGVTELLISYGFSNFIVCDTAGAIYEGREKNMNSFKNNLAKLTNREKKEGNLEEMLKGADAFIGLSAAGALKPEWIKTMNEKPIIFALANPVPEILPNEAHEAGAFIVATGNSDFKNQVTNSLAYPGVFRAAIDTRTAKIDIEMKKAASVAIANLVESDKLKPELIIPDSLDPRVLVVVANAVAHEAIENNKSRNKKMTADRAEENILRFNFEDKILNWEEIEETKLKWNLKK